MYGDWALNPTLVLIILLAVFFLLALYAAIWRIADILGEKNHGVYRQGTETCECSGNDLYI